MHAQLLGSEDHQQRFTRSLKMPDQAFLHPALHHPVDDLVGSVILLEAANDLGLAMFLIGGKQGEVFEDIQNDCRAQHAQRSGLQFIQTGIFVVIFFTPGCPAFQRLPDGAIAIGFPFGGK